MNKAMKRQVIGALKRKLAHPIYITEVRDVYSRKIASVSYLVPSGLYSVEYKKFIVRRNRYEGNVKTLYANVDDLVKDVSDFIG